MAIPAVVIDIHFTQTQSAFATAYLKLDNVKAGACGLTERERARELIMVTCSISTKTFNRLVKDARYLQNLSKSEQRQISIILNQDIRELFK